MKTTDKNRCSDNANENPAKINISIFSNNKFTIDGKSFVWISIIVLLIVLFAFMPKDNEAIAEFVRWIISIAVQSE